MNQCQSCGNQVRSKPNSFRKAGLLWPRSWAAPIEDDTRCRQIVPDAVREESAPKERRKAIAVSQGGALQPTWKGELARCRLYGWLAPRTAGPRPAAIRLGPRLLVIAGPATYDLWARSIVGVGIMHGSVQPLLLDRPRRSERRVATAAIEYEQQTSQ